MLDMILWAPDKATLKTWAASHPTANPLMDEDGNAREGVRYCWWGGDGGKILKTQGTYDAEGNELTPPEFFAGVAVLLKVYLDADKLADQNIDGTLEQWERSKVAQWIKDNGSSGTVQGVSYWEVDGVRMFRPDDVLAVTPIPHTWVDGCAY